MNKALIALSLTISLAGCDDANKAIEEAKVVANKAVDSLQKKADSLDMSNLNLEVFGDATQKAQEFTESINYLVQTDLSDHEAVAMATDKISGSYACLVKFSTEATAENLLDRIVSSVKNDQVLAIIEKGVAKANTAKDCIM